MLDHSVARQKDTIKAMAEVHDTQRINNVTITVLALHTSLEIKSKKALIEVRFFDREHSPLPVKLKQELNDNQSIKEYSILSQIDKALPSATYKVDCLNDNELSAYFKYLFEGSIAVTMKTKNGKAVVGQGSLPAYPLLRQGSEKVVTGFVVTMRDPADGVEVGKLHLMLKNSGKFVPAKTIRKAN